MIRLNPRFTALAAGVAVAASCALVAPTPAQAKARAKHVFIISFDGGKPSVMKESKMPTLFAMEKTGATQWGAQTTIPSITLTSHTSMLTGVDPKKHQVYWNDWQPEKHPIKVVTSFQLAKRKGYKTAMFAGKEKFKHLNLPGTLDKFDIPSYSCKKVAADAAAYIVSEKPNLCFIHFADSDGAGHTYGWGTPEQKQAFADEDEALLVVRQAIKKAGIEKNSVIIMSADHGGHDKTHGYNIPEDMTIPWIAWGRKVKKNFTITAPVTTYDTAATALWLLDVPIPSDWDGKPVTSAFTK